MITLDDTIGHVMRMLDDEDGAIWPIDQISGFVKDGYDAICRDVPCLFDMVMFTNTPLVCNYTRPFEVQYMTGPIMGQFNFTRESDREFTEDPIGPCNHTHPGEGPYMTSPVATPRTLGKMPDGYVEVDRLTHNWLPLKVASSRTLRETRTIYETMQSGTFTFSMEQDGLFMMRTVGVVVSEEPTETVQYGTNPDGSTNYHGSIRAITSYSYDQETVTGRFGRIRSMPQHFASGIYGGVKRIVPDDLATRVEFYRLGRDPEHYPFELPDRAMRYVEFWALFRAYACTGPGESKELAEHYKTRYLAGADRLRSRIKSTMDERTIAMGNKRHTLHDTYLGHFPANYGYTHRWRR